SDNVAVTSLTVNGTPVGLAADGSFSAPVTLAPGQNTVTAVAKDGAGNASQAQTTVVYAPPAKTCTVPNVRHKTLVVAKRAIVKATCRVGKVTAKKSRTVKPGRVISQSVKAARKVPVGTKISLAVAKHKAPVHKR